MDIEFEKAKRALLGLGNFKVSDTGELLDLDLGKDGRLHIPFNCNRINEGKMFSWAVKGDEYRTAKLQFSEGGRFALKLGVIEAKPYNSNRGSEITVYFDKKFGVYHPAEFFNFIYRLENVKVNYVLKEKYFVHHIAKIISWCGLTKNVGLRFLNKTGEKVVLIGVTDVTEKFRNMDILTQILNDSELISHKYIRDKLCNILIDYGFCDEGAFPSIED